MSSHWFSTSPNDSICQFYNNHLRMYLCRKDYAKDPDNVPEEMMCLFCMDVCVEPVMCAGTCKTIGCRRCVSEYFGAGKKGTVHCPKKCLDVWRYTIQPRKKLQFVCPYSKECIIEYPQDLQKHLADCPHQPPELLLKRDQRKNNLCINNHELKFFCGTYAQMIESSCSECHEKEVIRHKCLKCDLRYCVKCRVPVCGKDRCPLGHGFMFEDKITSSYICDICSMPPSLFGKGVYDDTQCNFGICEFCYEKLPETIELDLKQSKKAAKVCQNDHPLTPNPSPDKQHCFSCQKHAFCPTTCLKCSQYYCLKCKQPIVKRGVCQFGHQYVPETLPLTCMICEQQSENCLTDKQCFTILCNECYTTHFKISEDKTRIKYPLMCPEKHVLRYTSSLNFVFKCKICQIIKKCQQFCVNCKPAYAVCYDCLKPPNLKVGECLAGDKLQPFSSPTQMTCLVCQYQKKEFLRCEPCNFYVCLECKQQYN